jgi:DNA invertase Pin-like site-specific DNA recombinase
MTPLRAANLGRVSKDKSGEARSVGEQHEENAAAAAANGWTVTEKYEDVMSASRFAKGTREDWPRLVADVEAGKLDVVILWEPSRGSRKLGEWITFLDLCRDRGVLIHVTSHRYTYDQSSYRDRETLVNEGTKAEGESEKTSERVLRALAANAADGMPHSHAPFGYRRVYDDRGHLNRDQAQRPVEAEAALVSRVVGLVAAEVPLSEIERGTGVRRSTIRKWVANAAYVGKVRTPGGLVPARWPAIVDEGIWRAAQAVLAAKPRAGVNSRPGGARYLLSGIMTCCECSAAVEADPDSARRRACYGCRTGHVTIAQAGADEVIRWLVIARCAEDDLYQILTAAAGDDAEQARAEAVRLEAELAEWLTAGVSARAYKAKEDELLPLIAAARDRAEQLTVPAPVRDLAAAGADVAEVWDRMTVTQKRGAVRFLFESVTLQRSPRPGPGVPAHERITWEWRTFGPR